MIQQSRPYMWLASATPIHVACICLPASFPFDPQRHTRTSPQPTPGPAHTAYIHSRGGPQRLHHPYPTVHDSALHTHILTTHARPGGGRYTSTRVPITQHQQRGVMRPKDAHRPGKLPPFLYNQTHTPACQSHFCGLPTNTTACLPPLWPGCSPITYIHSAAPAIHTLPIRPTRPRTTDARRQPSTHQLSVQSVQFHTPQLHQPCCCGRKRHILHAASKIPSKPPPGLSAVAV